MVGKLAPNSSQMTRGLVTYVLGRGYFRAVSSQNGDKFVTFSPPPQSLNGSPPSWDLDDTLDNDYILYDDLMREVRDYTGVLGFTVNISANQEIASGVSADLQVQGLVDQIHDLTRRDLRTLAAPFPGAASSAEPLPGAVREPLSGGASPSSGGGASLEIEGLSPAPVPATARRGAPMRNNRVHRPNVATRRATAELTGAITRYRGVRSNNNNDDDNNISNSNHATLAELFQPSTLHKLRQLVLYTKTDTPDAAHQLHAEADDAEVTYTMINTQPSCSGGRGSDRVPNTFKEALGLLQVARWKTASDKEIVNLEKHGVFDLVPITSVPAGHKVVGTRWVLKIKAGSTYEGRLVVQGFS